MSEKHSLSNDAERASSGSPVSPKAQVVDTSSLDSRVDGAKVIRKIDLRVIPMLTLLYLMAFLDRVNIGNAQVYGMGRELGLRGNEYNFALCIFFIPYILFEIPSNALMKRIRPHKFLGFMFFMFGLVTIAQGYVKNYGGLLATRFFLGFFETGVFPGCFYLLAMWYKREESQKRFTFFFLSTALAGAFGGLIATGIGKLDGKRGMLAWRWIFIIEGAITCACAILGYLFITDFPEDAKWLSEEEREWVKRRLAEDVGESGMSKRHVQPKDVLILFKDYKFIVGAFMYFGLLISAYGFAYFAPTIIRSWNFSPIQTQLRTVPIWAVSWVVAMAVSVLSDHLRHRYTFLIIFSSIAVIGYIVLLTIHNNTPVQYGALFLAQTGTFASMPLAVCWFSTNLAGHKRRSLGTAFQISFGNFGGVIATFVFLQKDAPHYTLGYSLSLGMLVLAMISSTVYLIGIKTENKNRAAGKSGVIDETDEDAGDTLQSFRYSS